MRLLQDELLSCILFVSQLFTKQLDIIFTVGIYNYTNNFQPYLPPHAVRVYSRVHHTHISSPISQYAAYIH